MDLKSANGQLAAVAHRIPRVDDEIDDDLLEHVRIGHDRRQLGGDVEAEDDVRSKQTAQHFSDLSQGFLDVHDFLLHDLLAAEGQHLLDQRGDALHPVIDMRDGFDRILVQIGIVHQQGGMALDYGENIVKFVGQAASQASHRRQPFLAERQFLAVLQGALGRFAFRHFLAQFAHQQLPLLLHPFPLLYIEGVNRG